VLSRQTNCLVDQRFGVCPTRPQVVVSVSNVSVSRRSRGVILNVSSRYHLGLVAITTQSHLDTVTPTSRSRPSLETLTSRSRVGLGIIRLIYNPATLCHHTKPRSSLTTVTEQCQKSFTDYDSGIPSPKQHSKCPMWSLTRNGDRKVGGIIEAILSFLCMLTTLDELLSILSTESCLYCVTVSTT